MKVEKFNKISGSILKQLRLKNGLTMLDVAEKFGHTKSWLNDLESGRNGLSWRDVRALCQLYGINVNEFSFMVDAEMEKDDNGSI